MRFAIIGCGQEGSRRAAAAQPVENAEITVCVDAIADRAAALASLYGADSSSDWRTVVSRDDVDAVIIATSNNLHSMIAMASAQAGKHILCERPLARNPAEAEQMVRAARDYKVKLKTGVRIRHSPIMAKAKEVITSGRIGKIIYLRGHTGRGGFGIAPPSDWMVNCEISGGGVLMDNGMDLLDLCRFFMGDFKYVSGRIATLLWPIDPCEDNAFALLTRTDGCIAQVHSSWTDWNGYLSLEIAGTEGYLKLDYDEVVITVGARPGTTGAGLEESFDLSTVLDQSLSIEIKDLADAVEQNREPATNGTDGLETLILAHSIYRSSSEGVMVKT